MTRYEDLPTETSAALDTCDCCGGRVPPPSSPAREQAPGDGYCPGHLATGRHGTVHVCGLFNPEADWTAD